MPTPGDLLTEQLDREPDDLLRLMMGQDQGANLAGGPDATPDAQTPPSQGGVGGPGAQPVAPSPNVPGPLSALASSAQAKPKIKLKTPAPRGPKPRIKLKTKPKTKPRITLKAAS